MATMTKTQLVKLMAGKLELTNKQAATFLETLSEVAVSEAKKNGVFVFPGLGRLKKVQRKARMGRNPQTAKRSKSRRRPWPNSMSQNRSRTLSPQGRNSSVGSSRQQ